MLSIPIPDLPRREFYPQFTAQNACCTIAADIAYWTRFRQNPVFRCGDDDDEAVLAGIADYR